VHQVIKFVPHQEAWVVERFGKFSRILTPGLNVLMPFIDQVKYVHSLKEIALNIPSQSAVTNGTGGARPRPTMLEPRLRSSEKRPSGGRFGWAQTT